LKRLHICAAWLAIIALLIDGLLPTAVAAAASPNTAAPLAMCNAAGGSQPTRHAPALPMRHCALCAGFIAGLLPPDRPNGIATRLLVGAAHPAIVATVGDGTRHADYPAAQPRAPPVAV
jgi:hypothetical protein